MASTQLDIARANPNAPTVAGVISAAPGSAPGVTADARPSLIGKSRKQLTTALQDIGIAEKESRMRASQIYNWLYVRGARSFSEMANISKAVKARLDEHFSIARMEVVTEQISTDGTRKWLLRLPDGNEVETVFIPEPGRGTLCVSSQVGCTLTCSFCHTGTQKLVRNLTPDEITGQVLIARDSLGEWPEPNTPSHARERSITNVVMMGMGEPLYNFDNVRDALDVVSDGDGLSISKRRITLSTSGVVPDIARCGEEMGVMLAISLHAVRDDIRNELVPINKKYPIAALLDACRNYPGVSNARRITFEYVMLKGVNDSDQDARELVRLLKGIPAKINLIPFNPWPGSAYECSDWDRIEAFAEIINRAGYASPVRTPRGRDILAACGQLKSESEKERASVRLARRRAEAQDGTQDEPGSAAS
ncbi:23S rRNA (adenine(2503)-C(2))-methyltransferase RlmN [Pyruvatibacter mobilis]|uniref:Dual-specificity RNA methyltransferase RlmN n=1 Tax=Pyruvatibacter mobilis TaxID=1712261 RepID=A0A845Q7L3_9HYPH|nr:23S rRNA (adenine(2503)-C(2))-methyltransferase RlmN [Pyruvatibacter mobilis]NBG94180.1 23S rRNA (adenine(2503)-C(2))-methyltransferase RlmN [Pyruvatibacter mobilis]QJD76489.1 23S rRNA (adenine(2503)-C(2))-methyltransferase RlmN [Pyruvatibacter mobilis]GGD01004.1 dual-specificity RNA methyltransferase RlmN [Pyruvatibacter mobilis]